MLPRKNLVKEFKHINLVQIDKNEYLLIRQALSSNMLMQFSTGAWMGGDLSGWSMKSEPSPTGTYFLVEHYEKKAGGGLGSVYKADRDMLSAFRKLAGKT